MTDLPNQHAADALPYAAAAPSGGSAAAPRAETEAPAIPVAKTDQDATRPAWPSITHKLLYPLAVEGADPVTTIEVREPDLEALEAVLGVVEAHGLTDNDARIGLKTLRPLLAALTGIPDASLKRLHFKDATALMEKMAPLLEGLTS